LPPSTSLSREQAWLLAVLALIAGYVDAYTFLNYQVYGSFMSGNTTQAGLNAGEGDLASAGYNFLPIPIFVAGVFIGTFLVYSYLANRLRLLFTLVAALLLLGIATVTLTPGAAWAARHRDRDPNAGRRLGWHHRAELGDGHHEYVGHECRAAEDQPRLCERNLEQPREASCARRQGTASFRCNGSARHACAAGGVIDGNLDRVCVRSAAGRDRDPALFSVKSCLPGCHPVGACGPQPYTCAWRFGGRRQGLKGRSNLGVLSSRNPQLSSCPDILALFRKSGDGHASAFWRKI